MTLDFAVAALVLFAAVMHASWNALVKIGRDRLVTQALVIGVGSFAGLLTLMMAPLPAPESWPFIGLSIVAHSGYYAFLVLAYGEGDLSQVYPMARGVAPLSVAAMATLFAGERLRPLELIGVSLVSLGILSLAFIRGVPSGRDVRPVALAVATGLFISTYSVVDGIGVRRAGTTLGFIGWLFFLDGIPLLVATLVRRGRAIWPAIRETWRPGVLGGSIATVGYAIVVWAMARGGLAHVVSLRETSVIVAALIGTLWLGESARGRKLLAATLVAVGNLLLQLSR